MFRGKEIEERRIREGRVKKRVEGRKDGKRKGEEGRRQGHRRGEKRKSLDDRGQRRVEDRRKEG